MYNTDTELLFPPRFIPALRDERGPVWQNLVADLEKSGPESIEQAAFILMMAHLNNCAACSSASYRAMQGCANCAKQSIKRFRGPDEELLALFQSACIEVTAYMQKKS